MLSTGPTPSSLCSARPTQHKIKKLPPNLIGFVWGFSALGKPSNKKSGLVMEFFCKGFNPPLFLEVMEPVGALAKNGRNITCNNPKRCEVAQNAQ